MPSQEYINKWNPDEVTLTNDTVDEAWKACVLQGVYGENESFTGDVKGRISAVFVVFLVSTCFTLFPVVARGYKRLKIPITFYLLARFFGTGVIVATAFIHLIDPAYLEIGGLSCVGQTGNWSGYPYVAAMIVSSLFLIFVVNVYSNIWVETKYGVKGGHSDDLAMDLVTTRANEGITTFNPVEDEESVAETSLVGKNEATTTETSAISDTNLERIEFSRQIGAFLILEFGIIFHSVMIGLNLGVTNNGFKTLYIAIIFHQSFEGLGIGARLSAIPMPKKYAKWLPILLCVIYGLATPLCFAIGLSLKNKYNASSYQSMVVTGVLDAISGGILVYSGVVELLAYDFLYDPHRPRKISTITWNLLAVMAGAATMAVLGKWA